MRIARTLTALAFAFTVALLCLPAAATLAAEEPQQGGRPLAATLSGDAEVPGPGDPDGSGTFSLTVNPGQEEICFVLTVADVDTPTAAHIHSGAPDESGPPVVTLEAPADGSSDGCMPVERDLATALVRDPGDYYVNVHNEDFPDGAVRGQLVRELGK